VRIRPGTTVVDARVVEQDVQPPVALAGRVNQLPGALLADDVAGDRSDLRAGLPQPEGGAVQFGTVARAQEQTAAAPGQFGGE
jgi:hypothetical protein